MFNKLLQSNSSRTYYDKNGWRRYIDTDRRTGFKFMLKLRKPMSQAGISHYSTQARLKLRRVVWVYYCSSRAIGLPDGIPIAIMRNNKVMVEFLINNCILANGETYALHGYCHKKTKFHVGLTKTLALITVHDTERMTYTLTNTKLLQRYWFRKEEKNRIKKMWGG